MPQDKAPTKPFYTSKTFGAFGLLILAGLVTSAGLTWFAGISAEVVMVLAGSAGIALRIMTTKPVSIS